MLTKRQLEEIDAAMLEPEDLIEEPVKPISEIDQLADLSNAVAMLESKAQELEKFSAMEHLAYMIRCQCRDWRADIAVSLKHLRKTRQNG